MRAVVRQSPVLCGVIDVVDFAAERNGERDVDPAKLRGVIETSSDPRYRHGLGTANPALNWNFLHDETICWPPIPEQHETVAVLDAIDRKIDLHLRKKAVLEELFKSLLHKLMTGEIRVADLDLSALRPREAAA